MFSRKKNVYVLGAGPAGLLAAHAATQKGHHVQVFSAPGADGLARKSDLFGCQYLHSDIPGITANTGRPVQYFVEGSADAYREKVYGTNWQGQVSPDEYGPEKPHLAWNLRKAYDELWHKYSSTIVPVELGPHTMVGIVGDPNAFVLNTIPAPALCRDMENHKFVSQNVWAMGTTTDSCRSSLPYRAPDNTIVCNGHRDTAWYRAATVFGYSTLEWPGGKKPPITGVAAVSKPLSTDCTCWQGKRVLRLGRFGLWTKGVLVHTSYFDAMNFLP